MKFLGFHIPGTTKEIAMTAAPEPIAHQRMAFSTPFLRIGEGDLSKPFVSKFHSVGGFVRFGQDNLYPQLVNQLAELSPIHSACVRFTVNATVGGGYTFANPPVTGLEQVALLTIERKLKLKKLVALLTRDFLLHHRVLILVTKNPDGSFKSLKRLNPESIRQNTDNTLFGYSSDWSRTVIGATYPLYDPMSKDIESIYIYQDEVLATDPYALSPLNSINNWAALDSEQSYLQKQNILHSVYPSLVLRVPFEFNGPDEAKEYSNGIKMNAGAQGAGRVMILDGQGIEAVPEVVQIQPNSNDKLFEGTDKILTEKICQAHMINPSIMGVKVAGSLGNAQELQVSYAIYEKNVVLPLRLEMTEIINDILDIAGAKNAIVINNYQIIDNAITGTAPAADATLTLSDEMKKEMKQKNG